MSANRAELHSPDHVVWAGAPLESAKAALILVHGRGATAESMMPLAEAFGRDDIAFLAPKASGNVWYPQTFLAPLAANEPWLSSALAVIGTLIDQLGRDGFGPERIGLLGFSQGACLSAEYAARNARRYGCIAVLSGGLIGPPGTPRDYPGSLAGTPVFLGCSDVDFHIPLERVQESAKVLSALGADVDERIYPGMDHTVNADEIQAVRSLLANLVGDAA